jgi:hypothetical protein
MRSPCRSPNWPSPLRQRLGQRRHAQPGLVAPPKHVLAQVHAHGVHFLSGFVQRLDLHGGELVGHVLAPVHNPVGLPGQVLAIGVDGMKALAFHPCLPARAWRLSDAQHAGEYRLKGRFFVR